MRSNLEARGDGTALAGRRYLCLGGCCVGTLLTIVICRKRGRNSVPQPFFPHSRNTTALQTTSRPHHVMDREQGTCQSCKQPSEGQESQDRSEATFLPCFFPSSGLGPLVPSSPSMGAPIWPFCLWCRQSREPKRRDVPSSQ